ncbi:MAG TPA: GNAT family N-acetyltransferase [Polyangiaceae bacterium]|nr:GNAT family N-acetyltransferase [Polyangiaceae bacterium]
MRAAPEATLAIRTAAPSDAPFVRQLGGEAFSEYDPHAERATARMLVETASKTLIAEREGRPVGFVIVKPDASRVLALNAIAVLPSERGRGIGQRLLRAAEQYGRSQGMRAVALNTAQANLAALDLFLRAGFVITERTAMHYRRGQAACRLEKRLA